MKCWVYLRDVRLDRSRCDSFGTKNIYIQGLPKQDFSTPNSNSTSLYKHLNMATLITYASAHGSTQGVAERMAAVIDAEVSPGYTTCLPIDQVTDVSKYSFVLIGSAVHGFEWLPAATRFVHNNRTALSSSAVWAFSVGSPVHCPRIFKLMGLVEDEKKMISTAINNDIKTKEHVLLSGNIQKENFDKSFRFWWTCLGGKWGDKRDWKEIDAWASKVATEISRKLQGADEASVDHPWRSRAKTSY